MRWPLVADPAQTLNQWLTAQSIDPFVYKVVRQQSYGMYTADPEAIGVGFFAYIGTSGDRSLRIEGGSIQLAIAFTHFLGGCLRRQATHPSKHSSCANSAAKTNCCCEPKNSLGAG
ncbi:hypothetical protein GNF10_36195 [Nostoc sp. UCD121]|uniref:hypothetical protein n=1 Tax=unclassified Nostoc TaxID=2593658 RepID=UPI0016256BC0|nr:MULTISPECIES: hypothetical protein [unclassified Nostoc]MBC1221320.1 hypothetical protein [Nostoc sp. UCD120]MBC1281219.1 hypothetical protein [Nostoc sp. UCD121]MBC1294544.1 hypothetical protein [Nostoc sp. UCD122]